MRQQYQPLPKCWRSRLTQWSWEWLGEVWAKKVLEIEVFFTIVKITNQFVPCFTHQSASGQIKKWNFWEYYLNNITWNWKLPIYILQRRLHLNLLIFLDFFLLCFSYHICLLFLFIKLFHNNLFPLGLGLQHKLNSVRTKDFQNYKYFLFTFFKKI